MAAPAQRALQREGGRARQEMTQEEIGAHIIVVASRFIGLQETKQNAEWDNPSTAGRDEAAEVLRKSLKAVGWLIGWPYCAAFVEACWRIAYSELGAPQELMDRISQRLTPSVMQSFNNWKTKISTEPEPGAIFFMQMGNTAHGHAGIVVQRNGDAISTIEGNTSPMPGTAMADREGDGIFKKVRRLDFNQKSGLWLRGFINPLAW